MSEGLDYVLGVLAERGLSVHVSSEGKPSLRGPGEEVTPALRAALDAYRDDILARFPRDPEPSPQPEPAPEPPAIARLSRPQGRQWLWRFGQTHTETPDDLWLWGHPERHAAGAWWFRLPGGPWQAIPGRNRDFLLTLTSEAAT